MRTSKRKPWSLLALILAVPASVPTLAADEPETAPGPDIVFSAGRKGGGYWGIAERLQAVGAESGLKVEVLQSVGSIENLERPDRLHKGRAAFLPKQVG